MSTIEKGDEKLSAWGERVYLASVLFPEIFYYVSYIVSVSRQQAKRQLKVLHNRLQFWYVICYRLQSQKILIV